MCIISKVTTLEIMHIFDAHDFDEVWLDTEKAYSPLLPNNITE